MDTANSDERIMQCLARGQDDALGELVSRWEAPLWCFIDRMCPAPDVTDDVYQEVWTRIFLYRKRYDPAKPFRPYLFTIALNCCRRALKRRRWRSEVFASLDRGPPPVAAGPRPAHHRSAAVPACIRRVDESGSPKCPAANPAVGASLPSRDPRWPVPREYARSQGPAAADDPPDGGMPFRELR